MNRYQKWAEREYPLRRRLPVLIGAGLFFVVLLPILLIQTGARLDRRFHLRRGPAGGRHWAPGAGLIGAGLPFALGSVWVQITRGRGTPVPAMPTQKLLTTGPFALSRNPMTLGTILIYLGLAVGWGSASAVAIVLTLSSLLLAYIKRVEERELEMRFGDDYREYRARTPFLIPRMPRR